MNAINRHTGPPKTVSEAVEVLLSLIPLRSKIEISKMPLEDLSTLRLTLGIHIRNLFRLDAGNRDLLASCREVSQDKYLHPVQAPSVIITALWNRLQTTCRMRIVK